MKDNYFLVTNNNEWLLTNGIGGYALGTGNLINQRKYHGLLISSDNNLNRYSLLSGLEIMIEWRGGTFHIDSTNYSSCIYPEGFLHLVKSWLRPYPIFLFSSLNHNNDILILMELMMAVNENSILIKFTNLGRHKLHFHIRPKLTMRNHHHLNRHNTWEDEPVTLSVDNKSFSVNRVNNGLTLTGLLKSGAIIEERIVFQNCYYPWEAIRGYYGVEDLLSPVKISFDLQVNEINYLLFSDIFPIGNSVDDIIEQYRDNVGSRYNKLPYPKDYPSSKREHSNILITLDYEDNALYGLEDYLTILRFCLQDFIISGDIIAGYPWFGCWGRDTFITLEALINSISSSNQELQETTIDTIKQIFKKYGSLIKEGLLPNMQPESGQEGNYDSIDSCLWYVIRAYQFLEKSAAFPKLKNEIDSEISEYCAQIVSGILSNKTYPYHLESDGLIYLDTGFASATWMDAKISGKAVTPRTGAPVEINALFYNALCCYRDMLQKKGNQNHDHISINELTERIKLIEKSFNKFWIDDFLADRFENSEPVKEYRPNALIAASLPYQLLSQEQLQTVVETAKKEFLTCCGLRTLSPQDYRFKKKYLGNQTERDNQYHQGTVWTFLLDFYAKSYFAAYRGIKSNPEIAEELKDVVSHLRNEYLKGHIGSVAEVFDGYKPRVPKGCPAQAWSVAALYNIELLIQDLSS